MVTAWPIFCPFTLNATETTVPSGSLAAAFSVVGAPTGRVAFATGELMLTTGGCPMTVPDPLNRRVLAGYAVVAEQRHLRALIAAHNVECPVQNDVLAFVPADHYPHPARFENLLHQPREEAGEGANCR